MRKTIGFVSALALMAGLGAIGVLPLETGKRLASQASSAKMFSPAQAQERPAAINGAASNYAVIAPTFLLAANGADSYIRLFNGAGTAGSTTPSNFSISMVGIPSGQQYGGTITIPVPHMASVQYPLQAFINATGAGTLANGDTSWAVYLQNADAEAGYQHVTYSEASSLFENMSTCSSVVNEQMVSRHSELVASNVHTARLANNTFPSTLRIHNYYNVPITYKILVFAAGSYTSGTVTPDASAGDLVCTITGIGVAANSTRSIPFADIENNPSCSAISASNYANVVFLDQSGGAPNGMLNHVIRATAYNGDINMSTVCAVNRNSTTSTGGSTGGGGGGVIISPYL